MAGHSKWANIKRKKAVVDAAKSRVWTKIIKEITISSRLGGGDPTGNPRLALAIDMAKANNMPKDNIERAIKKGLGLDEGAAQIEEIVYEGYGPGGVAYYVEAATDNVTRTVAEVRHAFSKHGGNLGAIGSVAYLFTQYGIITIPSDSTDEETLMMAALDAGASDIKLEEDVFEVYTGREDFFTVRTSLEKSGFKIESAELRQLPATFTKVNEEQAIANFKLMERLEENDDVTNVFNNLELDEETLAIAEKL